MITYIVRHDNMFDNPSTWAFTMYGEAAKLRDALNARGTGPDGEYHVEEEPHHGTAQEVLAELALDGWFDE